jgi:hypothetical protein
MEPTMNTNLPPTQATVLKSAAARPDGNIEPLPPTLRGGARAKVIEGLINKGLAVCAGDSLLITDAGYAAVGQKALKPKGVSSTDITNLKDAGNTDAPCRAIRPGTKLAKIIECLRQPSGATIAQMMLGTGWQAHTIRGAISGVIKKKLGLNVVSAKGPEGERVYRSIDEGVGG